MKIAKNSDYVQCEMPAALAMTLARQIDQVLPCAMMFVYVNDTLKL